MAHPLIPMPMPQQQRLPMFKKKLQITLWRYSGNIKKAWNHESTCVRTSPKAILEKWLKSAIEFYSPRSIPFKSYPDKTQVQEIRIFFAKLKLKNFSIKVLTRLVYTALLKPSDCQIHGCLLSNHYRVASLKSNFLKEGCLTSGSLQCKLGDKINEISILKIIENIKDTEAKEDKKGVNYSKKGLQEVIA